MASPPVRIQDFESSASKQEGEGEKDKEGRQSKQSSSRGKSVAKKPIKKWDSHGKGGGVKMSSTRYDILYFIH